MIKKRDREQIFLSDIPKDNGTMASVQISSVESAVINQFLQSSDHVLEEKVPPYWMPIPLAADEVSIVLASVSPMLNNETIYYHTRNHTDLGKFKLLIRSTGQI